jgi:hypothetical protein
MHWTHAFPAGSQSGVGAAQFALLAHATHWPLAVLQMWPVDDAQSVFDWQATQMPRVASQMGEDDGQPPPSLQA